MARKAMVTRDFTSKVYKVTYVTKDRQFIELSRVCIKGEDIGKVAELTKPDGSMVLDIEFIREDKAIYGIEATRFFQLAEIVDNRRDRVTKEYTLKTYRVTYVTRDRQFIDTDITVNEYDNLEEILENACKGVLLDCKHIGTETVVVGMCYEQFLQNAEIVNR